MPTDHFIGIDWGSTNARAMLFARDGTLVAHHDYPLGIKHVAAGRYRESFQQMTDDWRNRLGRIPVFLSGMIGSRHGWREVPYLACPASVADLAHHLVRLPDEPNVFIVPGLKMNSTRPDVMRGEELQVLGLNGIGAIGTGARCPQQAGFEPNAAKPDGDIELDHSVDTTLLQGGGDATCELVCIPGTHSKWIVTAGNVVRSFHTAMTGELFAAIAGHTLFAQLIPRETNSVVFRETAFDSGLQRSAAPHGLLHALFELRAALLLEHISAEDLADMISGLLIGTEIRHVQTLTASGKSVAVLGAAGISERYVRALQAFSFEPRAFAVQEVTARGFAALFRATVATTPAQ